MPCAKGGTMIRGNDLKRFWSKTKRQGRCIIWTGSVSQHFGHGKFMTTKIGERQKTNKVWKHIV